MAFSTFFRACVFFLVAVDAVGVKCAIVIFKLHCFPFFLGDTFGFFGFFRFIMTFHAALNRITFFGGPSSLPSKRVDRKTMVPKTMIEC